MEAVTPRIETERRSRWEEEEAEEEGKEDGGKEEEEEETAAAAVKPVRRQRAPNFTTPVWPQGRLRQESGVDQRASC